MRIKEQRLVRLRDDVAAGAREERRFWRRREGKSKVLQVIVGIKGREGVKEKDNKQLSRCDG